MAAQRLAGIGLHLKSVLLTHADFHYLPPFQDGRAPPGHQAASYTYSLDMATHHIVTNIRAKALNLWYSTFHRCIR